MQERFGYYPIKLPIFTGRMQFTSSPCRVPVFFLFYPRILIIRYSPFSCMALPKKRGGKKKKPLIDTLPEMLVHAIAMDNDLVLTFETDPDTGVRKIHVMTGKFITPCMLRKLIGQVESQRDEGSTMVSRKWGPAQGRIDK
jgi:hypothetical protein